MALPISPGLIDTLYEQPPNEYDQAYMQRLIGELNTRSNTRTSLKQRLSDSGTDKLGPRDHTVIAVAGTTALTLPANPSLEQELYLVNTTGSSITVNGNGLNIWAAGSTASTASLLANTAAIIVLDCVSPTNVWRVIK